MTNEESQERLKRILQRIQFRWICIDMISVCILVVSCAAVIYFLTALLSRQSHWLRGGMWFVAIFILIAFIQKLKLFQNRTTLDAARHLDACLCSKERVISAVEIASNNAQAEILALLSSQIRRALERSQQEYLPHFKIARLVYGTAIVAVCALCGLFFIPPREISVSSQMAIQSIDTLIKEEKNLPSEVTESLSDLKETLLDNDLTSEEVEKALQEAEMQIEEAQKALATESGNEGSQKILEPTPTPTPQPVERSKKEMDIQNSTSAKEQEEKKQEESQSQDKKGGESKQDKESQNSQSGESKNDQGKGSNSKEGDSQSGEKENQDKKDSGDGSKDSQDQKKGEQGKGEQKSRDQKEGDQGDQNKEGEQSKKERGDKEGKQDQKGEGKEKQGEQEAQALKAASQTMNTIRKEQQNQQQNQGDSKQGKEGDSQQDQKQPEGKDSKGSQGKGEDQKPGNEQGESQQKKGEPSNKKTEQSPKRSDSKPKGGSNAEGKSDAQEFVPGEGDIKSPFGENKKFEETQIGEKDEQFDTRFTSKEGERAKNPNEAQPKTKLSDVTVARPQIQKEESGQPIPLEYRDVLE